MRPKHALWLLIVVSALVRLLCACVLGLGNDEAYHYLYATHPALSYFDHPPMMAWIQWAGMALPGAGHAPWALRLGFIGLFAGSTALLARLTSRHYGPWAGFLAAFALNATGYYGLAASTFVLPDGPLLFFWLLTIDRLDRALFPSRDERPGQTPPSSSDRHAAWAWATVGLAWGGAMLSKYHAVFLPMGVGLYVLLDRTARRTWLKSPGPYLAAVIGLLVFSPVLIWNAQHDWASFLFQGGRAVGGWTPRPGPLLVALIAQAGYLFPWIWLPLVAVLARGWHDWRSKNEEGPLRLWLCLAIVPLAVFTMVACFRPVLPHWGLIGLVSLFPVLGRNWAERQKQRPVLARRRLAICAGLSIGLVALALVEHRTGWLQRGDGEGGRRGIGFLRPRDDPTLDLYGWDQIASKIRELGLLDAPDSFVFTRYWYQSAQLAYALGGDHHVLCYNTGDARGFGFWERPGDWVGRDGTLVLIGDEPEVIARYFRRWFTRIEPMGEFWARRAGKPARRARIYRCIRQRFAYPFSRENAAMIARTPAPKDRSAR